MGAYMYPVKVNYKRQRIEEDHREVLDGPLTVSRLAELVGEGDFSVYEDDLDCTGWVITWRTSRPETDEEMQARIKRGEEYNKKRDEFMKRLQK